jgi:Na+-transporting methylmalonyl-CoA/oxaloacetate decarboxylase gamma subunit
MEDVLVIALIITAIGMTLLFLALTVFYGLLTLATRVFHDRAPEPGAAVEEEGADEQEAAWLAAALAVSLARAQGEGKVTPMEMPVLDDSVSMLPSSWWTLHQQRNRSLGPSAWRAQ